MQERLRQGEGQRGRGRERERDREVEGVLAEHPRVRGFLERARI